MQSLSLLELEVCGLYNETICYNNGTCINGLCVCPSPYTGYDCLTEICECMSSIPFVLRGIVLRIAQLMYVCAVSCVHVGCDCEMCAEGKR